MKNLLFFLFITLSSSLFAQKPALVSIQTNAQCGDCKDRIETALNQAKGVVYAELNMETKVVEVKYKVSKTDVATLQKVLNLAGYDADDHKADTAAQKALPLCCQPRGHWLFWRAKISVAKSIAEPKARTRIKTIRAHIVQLGVHVG